MNTPYPSTHLTVTSPVQSFTEIFTVDQVRNYLREDDRMNDAELLWYIVAAREQAEILQGRELVVKQWDMSLDTFCGGEIELRPALQSVDLVQYRDSTGATSSLVENTDYIVDAVRNPGVVMPPYGKAWPAFIPYPSSAVLIRFRSGWTADQVPMLVKQGMLFLISAWWNNKLPFEIGAPAIQEYPHTVSDCLRQGAIMRLR